MQHRDESQSGLLKKWRFQEQFEDYLINNFLPSSMLQYSTYNLYCFNKKIPIDNYIGKAQRNMKPHLP